ncbi:MAG: LysM peptidoglycan-binding domain-containing protein [Lachnospiraceae bacterium]|nr:LysM peptidoglycan-binding domain-containing protein [Lachnospiraceae bacterium]
MYAEGTMTREEFRRARREQIHREQQSRRRRILIFLVTIVVMFGMGVGFGTLLAKAEETEKAPAYKYYANIEIQKGDTLWEIADAYMDADHYRNWTEYINEVMKLNHMVSDHLVTGEKLIVPYYSTEVR